MKFPFPSKFAAGNAALATLIFMGTGALLYVLSELYTYVYACGAITFYVATKLYRRRAKHHKLLHPPSIPQLMYEIRVNQTEIDSRLDDIDFKITYMQGGE